MSMENKSHDDDMIFAGSPSVALRAPSWESAKIDGALSDGQRWTASRKLAVVTRFLRGESLELVSREVGVPIYQLEEWRDKALSGMESALKAHAYDHNELKLAEAQRRIGEITMENELLRERCNRDGGPFVRGRSQK